MLCMAESRNDNTYRMLMMQLGGFYFDAEGNPQVNSDVNTGDGDVSEDVSGRNYV